MHSVYYGDVIGGVVGGPGLSHPKASGAAGAAYTYFIPTTLVVERGEGGAPPPHTTPQKRLGGNVPCIQGGKRDGVRDLPEKMVYQTGYNNNQWNAYRYNMGTMWDVIKRSRLLGKNIPPPPSPTRSFMQDMLLVTHKRNMKYALWLGQGPLPLTSRYRGQPTGLGKIGYTNGCPIWGRE